MRITPKETVGVLVAVHVCALILGFALLFVLEIIWTAPFLLAPCLVAQIGLLNTWLVFGGREAPLRLLVWGCVMFFASLPLMCAPLVVSVVHVAILGVLRWRVAGVYYFIGDAEAAAHRRIQFSIGRLMAATAAVSVVLAAARFFRTFEPNDPTAAAAVGLVASLASIATVAVSHAIALWAVLGTEHPRAGLAGSTAISAGLGAVLAFALEAPAEVFGVLTFVGAAQAAIYGGSLLVIRTGDYRLFRHPPLNAASARAEDEIIFLDPSPRAANLPHVVHEDE
ncbi:MAG: hypothetical protein KY475_26515 [Planctomycetes bacterium]|nr:hypothetical protein [Planctomycetota bacterium]